MPADSDRIRKFIRMLGSPADAEVLKGSPGLGQRTKSRWFRPPHPSRGLGNGKGKAKRTATDCRPLIGLRRRRASRATPTARPQ